MLSPLNLAKAQYNSPVKDKLSLQEADDSFSFKLTQVMQNTKLVGLAE